MDNIDYNLISRYLAGETDKDENLGVEKWKNASTENKKLLAELDQVFQNAFPKQPPSIPDIGQAWLDIENRIGSTGKAKILPFTLMRWPLHGYSIRFRSFAVVALLVILIGAALLYNSPPLSENWQTTLTQNAQRLRLSLSDGSNVRLNSDSHLQYPAVFSDSTRTVYLSGEAFFEIEPQNRPFVVKTKNAEIRVLGTSFNIWARNTRTRVVVQEGRVAFNGLQNLNWGVVLNAKQTSSCNSNEIPSEPTEADLTKSLGWLENRIVFEMTPLHEIIAELRRYYDVEIQLEEPELGKHTLTGSFHNQPIDTVLASICLTLQLQYESQNGNFLIQTNTKR